MNSGVLLSNVHLATFDSNNTIVLVVKWSTIVCNCCNIYTQKYTFYAATLIDISLAQSVQNVCSSVPFLLLQLVTRTKKIFVGGLSVNTTIEDVKQYFDQFGKVSGV